jgi:hypothetical protein
MSEAELLAGWKAHEGAPVDQRAPMSHKQTLGVTGELQPYAGPVPSYPPHPTVKLALSPTAQTGTSPVETGAGDETGPLSPHHPASAEVPPSVAVAGYFGSLASTRGAQYTIKNMGTLISKTTEETLGIDVSPHLFRMAAATTAAAYGTSTPHLATAVMGHRDKRIAEEHYNRASSFHAGTILAEIIENCKSQAR